MRRRTIRSARLGELELSIQRGIASSGKWTVPQEIRTFVPKGKTFSFDTIWEVTRLHFLEFKQREEIQNLLPFPISTGSISNLYKEGLAYFRACHEAATSSLRKIYRKKGRLFILQVDGTNDGGKWTHYQIRDCVSGDVLLAKRISTENKREIKAMLREIEVRFGKPDAVISDMSKSCIGAVMELWEGTVPLFICQFHFLRDIGKDLLGDLHEDLRKSVASASVTRKLNALRASLAEVQADQVDRKKSLALIDWILDHRSELNGEGMPFDLRWKVYYERCQRIATLIDDVLNSPKRRFTNKASKNLEKIRRCLEGLIDNPTANKRYKALAESAESFEQIRAIFTALSEEGGHVAPLSRNAEAGASTPNAVTPAILHRRIDELTTKLRTKAITMHKADAIRHTKAAQQLEKHKERLSNHLEKDGLLHPIPRTNNLCELTFRETKRTIRRTNGKKNLARVFDQTPAELMLLQNLRNEEYCRIVFNGRPVYEVFADILPETVKEILAEMEAGHSRKKVDPAIKQPDFLEMNADFFIRRVS